MLINDNWLWYDGLGTKLQVFGRYDSGGQSDAYSCSLMFYEVNPMDKEAEKLIAGNDDINPSHDSDLLLFTTTTTAPNEK